MRYIRTKDGIYDYEKILEQTRKHHEIVDYPSPSIEIERQVNIEIEMLMRIVIKQADTIEELVDCYSYYTETTTDLSVARSWKKSDLTRRIYACILTDKGITYVGEINEKLDLELI